MIHYVGYGDRALPETPPIYPRKQYELLVLLEGRCGLVKQGYASNMTERSIWLMGKGSKHGWKGDGNRCRLLSVLLDHVESDLVSHQGAIHKQASPAEQKNFDALGDRLAEHRHDYSAMLQLSKITQGEIGLLFANSKRDRAPADWRVEHALAWFEQHMHESPNCDDIAQAVQCSAAHLRRLFQQAGMAPIVDRLDDLRLARATSMLTERKWTTEHIARLCGWGSASALTHAMRRRYQCTVKQWLAQNKTP